MKRVQQREKVGRQIFIPVWPLVWIGLTVSVLMIAALWAMGNK